MLIFLLLKHYLNKVGDFLKFIFPQNYKFKAKILGILDYSTAIFNIIWFLLIFLLVNLLFHTLVLKLFIFILLFFPVFLFSIIGFNHESFLYVFSYLIKFFKNRRIYLYKKIY